MNPSILGAYRERNQCRASAVLFLKHLGYEEISIQTSRGNGFVLEDILTEQMAQINTSFIDRRKPAEGRELIGRAVAVLGQSRCPYPLEESRRIFELLLDGMAIPSSGEGRLRYIDWSEASRNRFQFTVNYDAEPQGEGKQWFTDIVCFINGVPLLGIEVSAAAGLSELKGDCALFHAQIRSHGPPQFFGLLQVLILLCRSGGYYTSPENTGSPWLTQPFLAREDQWSEFLRELDEAAWGQSRRCSERREMARWVERRPVEWLLWSMCRHENLLELLSQFRIVGSDNHPGGLIDGWGQASVRAATKFFSIETSEDPKDRLTAVWRPENEFLPGVLEFLVRSLVVTPRWRPFRKLLILSDWRRRNALEGAFRGSGESWQWMRSPHELARGLSSESGMGLIGCYDDVERALEHCSSEGLAVREWLLIVDGDCGLGSRRGERIWRQVLTWGRIVFVSDRVFCDSALDFLRRLGMQRMPLFSQEFVRENGLLVPVYFEGRPMVFESLAPQGERAEDDCDSELLREEWLRQIARELKGDFARHSHSGARRVAVLVVGNLVDAFLLKEMLDESSSLRSVVLDGQIGLRPTEACGDETIRPSDRHPLSCVSLNEVSVDQRDLLLVPLNSLGQLRRTGCRIIYLVGMMDSSLIADAIEIVARTEHGKDFGLLVCFNDEVSCALGDACSPDVVQKTCGNVAGCQSIEVEVSRLSDRLEAIESLFCKAREGGALAADESIVCEGDDRAEFFRLFFEFQRNLVLAQRSWKWLRETPPAEQLRLLEKLRFFQQVRIRTKVRYAEDLDHPEFEGELLSMLGSENPVASGLAMPPGLNPLRADPFESLVASLPNAAAKGDIIACWIMKAIADRRNRVDPELTEISREVEAAVSEFAENSVSPHKYQTRVESALQRLRRVIGEPAFVQEVDLMKAEVCAITDRVMTPELRTGLARHSFALEEGTVEYMASGLESDLSQHLGEIAGQTLIILLKSLERPWLEEQVAENRFRMELDRYLLAFQEARRIHITAAATDEFIESLLATARQRFRRNRLFE